jgi:hypothetical protein
MEIGSILTIQFPVGVSAMLGERLLGDVLVLF